MSTEELSFKPKFFTQGSLRGTLYYAKSPVCEWVPPFLQALLPSWDFIAMGQFDYGSIMTRDRTHFSVTTNSFTVPHLELHWALQIFCS